MTTSEHITQYTIRYSENADFHGMVKLGITHRAGQLSKSRENFAVEIENGLWRHKT